MKQRKTTFKFKFDGIDYTVKMWGEYYGGEMRTFYHVYDNKILIGGSTVQYNSTKFDIVALSVGIIAEYNRQCENDNPMNKIEKTTEPQTLDDKIIALLEEHHTDDIFKSVVNNADTNGLTWLTDAAISYLQTYKGYNIVKADGLAQQMQLEETLQKIYPYATQEGSNLFLAIC